MNRRLFASLIVRAGMLCSTSLFALPQFQEPSSEKVYTTLDKGISPPIVIYTTDCKVSTIRIADKEVAQVFLKLLVRTDGAPENIEAIRFLDRSNKEILNAGASTAGKQIARDLINDIRQYRFRPGMNGQPVRFRITVQVRPELS